MLFEDRIDVDAYDAYELVHSAYARQVDAAALAPVPEITEGFQLLDIGTGPGLPLQMLLSLLPDLRVTAIDPSKRAFEYLSRRFADDLRVTLHNCCIGEFAGSGTVFDGALSIGASHHLDTGLIFRSARRSLLEGGLFVVYDEFIAPFPSGPVRCDVCSRSGEPPHCQ